jgi:hypothetical protein
MDLDGKQLETAFYLLGMLAVFGLYLGRSKLFKKNKEISIQSIETRLARWIVAALLIGALLLATYQFLE